MNLPNSTPYSVPAALPQPESANYTPDALALFKSYNRDTHVSEFGVQAAPWDGSRPPKAWFDSTASALPPNSPCAYWIVGHDQAGNWSLQTMTLPASEAATVNLQGAMNYPPYQPAPTKAARAGQIVNRVYMVTEADARTVMTEVGGDGLYDEGATTKTPVIYPTDEERKMWAFQVGGRQYYAGLLMASEYGLGVGWPGQWDSSRGFPQWVSDPPAPTGAGDSRAPVPMPVRALLPNERIQAGPMGLGVLVVRTDLASAKTAEGFTAEDRIALRKILEIVGKAA